MRKIYRIPEEMVEKARGNWKRFGSFAWFEKPDEWDLDNVCIVYTSNRDSGLLDQSNASVIAKGLEPFEDLWCYSERHSHFLCGYVDGYSILVSVYVPDWDMEVLTPAFALWCEFQLRMDNYPILDEEDYSGRELEALWENVQGELRFLVGKYDELDDVELTDELVSDVLNWLSENDSGATENGGDDQGGYPYEGELVGALRGLGIMKEEEV